MFSRACCMLLALGLPLSLAQSGSFPSPKSSQKVSATIPVSGVRDGGLVRYYADASKLGDGGQAEGQKPIFELADGATLKNVIIGAPAADGIHCKGSCTLENIYWEDVGEDAATFKGGANSRVVVKGGGAKNAHDKTFQHNGGGSVTIRNFYVENFGKLYRACGTCPAQKRTVTIENVVAKGPGLTLAGININSGDSATFKNVKVDKKVTNICQQYSLTSLKANFKASQNGDGTYCKYKTSDVKVQ